MTKNVETTIDIKIARMMLGVAGFAFVDKMTDDEVFEQALKMNEEYGVKSIIITLPDMREKVKEYISELDAEIDKYHNIAEQNEQIAESMIIIIKVLTEVKNDLQCRLNELI